MSLREDREAYADEPSGPPEGYRLLCEGEAFAVGDVYWSNGKWYTTFTSGVWTAKDFTPMAKPN